MQMDVIFVMIHGYNLNLWKTLVNLSHNLLKIFKTSCIEYFSPVFTDDDQMIFTLVCTVALLLDFHTKFYIRKTWGALQPRGKPRGIMVALKVEDKLRLPHVFLPLMLNITFDRM